jgi:hypothetical protein
MNAQSTEWVNTNIELNKQDIIYKKYVSVSMTINDIQYEKLIKSIEQDKKNWATWWDLATDTYALATTGDLVARDSDIWVCSSWATSKWNSIAPKDSQLDDENFIWMSTPFALYKSIQDLQKKQKP